MMRFLPPLLLSLGFALAQQAPAPCNGHAELCARRYSNITLVGSHNSAFVGTGVADNQETDVAAQLAQGVRFLQAQTHLDNNTIKLCHTLCALEDAGPLEAYLGGVRAFLDANPREVVTLLITNQDGQPGAAFDAVFRAAGIQGYGFAPGTNLTLDQWPTLGQMIDNGQRLVVFMGACMWTFPEMGIMCRRCGLTWNRRLPGWGPGALYTQRVRPVYHVSFAVRGGVIYGNTCTQISAQYWAYQRLTSRLKNRETPFEYVCQAP